MNTSTILEIFNQLNIPFYNKRIKDDFYSIPFMNKSDLLTSQEKFPPFGEFTNENFPIEQVYRTSGTTAKPLLLSFTKNDIQKIILSGESCFRFSGMGEVGNKEIVINCLNLSMWAGGFLDAQSMMLTGVKVINFGVGNTIQLIKLIKELTKSQKVSLHCTPSYLPILKKKILIELNTDASELGLWRIYLGAEGGLQYQEFKNKIESTWNCKALNANYGMSEVCSIMASANEENYLKFSNIFLNNYYNEIRLTDGTIQPLMDIQSDQEGELITTSLIKESQPILRYETHENIRIIRNDSSGVFFEVAGRKDDMFVVKGVNLFPEQFRSILLKFKKLTGVYKVEVSRSKGIVQNVTVICELAFDHDLDAKILLEKQIQDTIKKEIIVTCKIILEHTTSFTGNKLKLITFIEED